jgi:ketosteroid isomerase-like protein
MTAYSFPTLHKHFAQLCVKPRYQEIAMSTQIAQQIAMAEERLRLAMLASDDAVLDELISPDLIFTNHFGQVFGKQDDLGLHQSGILKFQELEPSEIQINGSNGFSVVSVRMKSVGTYGDSAFVADLRYTRIWRMATNGSWQIVAVHSSAIV